MSDNLLAQAIEALEHTRLARQLGNAMRAVVSCKCCDCSSMSPSCLSDPCPESRRLVVQLTDRLFRVMSSLN